MRGTTARRRGTAMQLYSRTHEYTIQEGTENAWGGGSVHNNGQRGDGDDEGDGDGGGWIG